MRPSTVARLYWTRLRHRLPQELLALAGIAIGVALVFAALVANTSLTGSMRELTKGVVGKATLQVTARGPDGFDARLLDRVRAMDDVEDAAAVLEARANLVGPTGRKSVLLVAGDYTFSSLGGTLLPHFDDARIGRQQALALPVPLAEELGVSVGQSIDVEVSPRTRQVPLGAPLRESDIGSLIHSPVALAPLAFAQRLTGLDGRVSRIFVEPRPGRESAAEAGLRRMVGDRLNVVAADADVAAFERAAYPTSQSTTLFSAFSALVGFLFAFSAMLLTVPQRQRLIADLQMAGHPPWVLLQVLLFDALVLGCAGSVVGLLVGEQLAQTVFADAPDYLSAAFAIGSQQLVTWGSAAIAAGCGVLAAIVAVLVPVRDVLTGHPLIRREAPSTRRASRVPFAAGAGCVAVTVAIAAAAPQAAIAAIGLLTLGLLLLLPAALRGSIALLAAVAGRWRTPIPTLVTYQLRSPAVRTRALALAATGAVAVFATVSIGGGDADLQRGLEESARDLDGNADIWVTFAGRANPLATTPFAAPDSTVARLRAVPGVHEVRAFRGSFLDVGDRRVWVLGSPPGVPQPIPQSQIRAGDPLLASRRVRSGGWVAVSEAVAADEELSVGDRFELPSPAPTELRVAAITSNLAWPPGAIVLNSADYARAWGTTAVSALQVDIEHGAAPPAVAASIERVLNPRLPVTVETRRERVLRHYATARDALARLRQISIVVLASAILALAAAMGGMIWQRRPAVARLKVQGYPQGELWQLMILENVLLLGTGASMGALFGLGGQVVLSRALETVTGFPLVYSAATAAAVSILAVVTLLAAAMLALPGWLAVRVAPEPDPKVT